jgi:hypothetical protein
MNSIGKLWDMVFPMPTPKKLAMQELQEAHRQLLLYQSQREYAAAMVRFNEDRVARLQAYE